MQHYKLSNYIINIRNIRAIFILILSFLIFLVSNETLLKEQILSIIGIIYGGLSLILEIIACYIWINLELSKGNKEEVMILSYGMIPKINKYYIFNMILITINIVMFITILILLSFIKLFNFTNIMISIILLLYIIFNIATNILQLYWLSKHIEYIKINYSLLEIIITQ